MTVARSMLLAVMLNGSTPAPNFTSSFSTFAYPNSIVHSISGRSMIRAMTYPSIPEFRTLPTL